MENRQFRLKRLKAQIYLLFLPLFLLILSLAFVGFGHFSNPYIGQFKMALIETVTPIVYVISTPVRWGKIAFGATTNFINTYKDNNQLRAENENLKIWRQIALQLQSEQASLQHHLNYVPPPKATFVTAKILTDNGGRFSHSLIVSAGSVEGVQKGDVAMTPAGIFGRIVEVGRHFSRLMLLTDYASRVPVMIGQDKINGILVGDGSSTPKLISLPENKMPKVGDIVLSSGQVGVYPTGLGIGVVESIDKGDIKVRLFEENFSPDFVKLVNFGINSVLLSDTCTTEE